MAAGQLEDDVVGSWKILSIAFVDEHSGAFDIPGSASPKSGRETLQSTIKNLEIYWITREEMFTVRRLKRE